METGKFSFLAMATLAIVTSTRCLDLRDVQEGSCGAIQDAQTLDDVDPTVLDRLHFVPAGSKYQLYRYARGHLHFDELRDFKFFYEACLFKNVSVEEGSGSTFGFGNQRLVTYDVRRGDGIEETGIATVTTERPGPGIETGESFTSRITLTDNKNFAVVVHCWEDVNQKGWSLYSRQYTLDREMRRMVEEHVLGLGFDRDNIAFLEYGGCKVDEDYDDGETLDLDFHFEGEDEAPPPTFENIERFSSIVTNKSSKSTSLSTDKDDSKEKLSSTKSKDKSTSSLKYKSSGSKKTSSLNVKSSESDYSKTPSKNTSRIPHKSSSSSKDKSLGSTNKESKDKSSSSPKDKSSESQTKRSHSKKTSTHSNESSTSLKDKSSGSKKKSSSSLKDKSSESNKNKSHSMHTSTLSNKSKKEEHSDSKHEKDHRDHDHHQEKNNTKKIDKKNKRHPHIGTHHSSEEDMSEEKFGKRVQRFRSGGFRRFGNVGGGWKR